jgi:RND superfamily putative drug exporter
MNRLTRLVLRFRWPVIAVWAIVLVAGGYGASQLSSLQSNVFTVPGSDSERVRAVLQSHFGDRPDGGFTIVFRVQSSADQATRQRLQRVMEKAAVVLPDGRATRLISADRSVLYGDILSTLNLAEAKAYADDVYRAVREQPPGTTAYVTGAAAIQSDLDPIFNQDLRRGELIVIPIALAVLLVVFGLSLAVSIPLLFAASTVFGTLGLVYIVAHWVTTPTYVTNLVFLIGLGIAVDYSLLMVYRYREELARGGTAEEAVHRTMNTAGRAVVVSGATVAIGLALLLFMPLPFMRAIGLGGFLIPLVSIAAAATLQPALLSIFGQRGMQRVPVARFMRGSLHIPLPRLPGSKSSEQSWWAALARSIMRRPFAYIAVFGALLIAAALPALALELTPGTTEGIPRYPQSVRGFDLLREAVGPGAVTPSQVLVDAGAPGAALQPRVQAAIGRLVEAASADEEVAQVYYLPGGRFIDPSGRYAQVLIAGKNDYGTAQAQAFVHRLRDTIIPSADWPAGVRVLAGGGPPQGVDFLHQAYGAFPWLVLTVLVLTYVLLLRAFRSWVLPLKAVLLNLLSVAAAYGMLVVAFEWGAGRIIGLYEFPQVEGWIPIFLFAMLFGLSMDYEVFLVSRMREAWDEVHDNERAVAIGLERTGRIITAAAVIMVAAFSGFLAGSIVGLQEFGLGLAVSIFIDATIVRIVLVPALMAVLGRYNWWLPARIARWVRVKPSPLVPHAEVRSHG